MKRNLNELEKNMSKYSELLSNILNFQESKLNLKNEILMSKQSHNVLVSHKVLRSNLSTPLIISHNKQQSSSSQVSNKKLKSPALKSFLLKKTSKSVSCKKAQSSRQHSVPKPILKSAKATENLETQKCTAEKQSSSSKNSKSNLIYQKSKSAENLNLANNLATSSNVNRASSFKSSSLQITNTNNNNSGKASKAKSMTNSAKKVLTSSQSNTSIYANANACVNIIADSSSANKNKSSDEDLASTGSGINVVEILTSSDKQQQQQQPAVIQPIAAPNLDDKIVNIGQTATYEEMLTNLNKNFDYFELLEFLTEKSKHLKQENRKLFISKIINLLTNAEKLTSSENDLESKLDAMKVEIDFLKKKLETPLKSAGNAVPRSSTPAAANIDQSHLMPQDLNNALNLIISNYFEKLTKMQQQIDELNNLNKCLFYIETNMNSEQTMAKNNNQEAIEKLTSELKASQEKCNQLSFMIEEKSKQTDQYIQLFKEISQNVNTLIKELEQKEMSNRFSQAPSLVKNFPHQKQPAFSAATITANSMANEPTESLIESRSLTLLRQNLAKFESKLKFLNHRHHHVDHSLPDLLTRKHPGDETDENKHIFVNLSSENQNTAIKKTINNIDDIKFNFDETTNTTSSNTLIDADSSFDSIKLEILRQGGHNLKNLFTKPVTENVKIAESNKINNELLLAVVAHKNAITKQIHDYNQQQQQRQNLKNQFVSNAYIQQTSNQRNGEHHIYAQFDDEEDEDEKIIISMDDLSITTIQTSNSSNNTNEEDPGEEEEGAENSLVISTNGVNEIIATNNEMTTTSIMNNNAAPPLCGDVVVGGGGNINAASLNSLNSNEDDYQFQKNLKKLDQKIFKVKQLLESMKSSN